VDAPAVPRAVPHVRDAPSSSDGSARHGRGPQATPAQKRRAVATAVVLALLVAGIYLTYMLKFAR